MKVVTFNLFGIKNDKSYFVERLEPLQTILLEEDADFLCLQEAHPDQVQALLDKYELSYTLTEALKGNGKIYTTQEESFLENHGVVMMLRRKTSLYEIVDKSLMWEGDFVDCGCIRLELRQKGSSFNRCFLYNCHFTGGSYGLDETELQRRRQYRLEQYHMLSKSVQDLIQQHNDDLTIVVTGDFNSDPDQLADFPEAKHALERLFPSLSPPVVASKNDDPNQHQTNQDASPFCFMDLWKTLKGHSEEGATESTSRNLFRAYLKPNQEREVRFDRVLVGTCRRRRHSFSESKNGGDPFSNSTIRLLGTEPVSTTIQDAQGRTIPIFPSDHFGLAASITTAII